MMKEPPRLGPEEGVLQQPRVSGARGYLTFTRSAYLSCDGGRGQD